jgi:alpha-galactosidase
MARIAFVGAGSTVFAKTLLVDILSFPELSESTISLHDVDAGRLEVTGRVAHRIAQQLNAEPEILTTTEREVALDGADYVITMIQVGGYDPATLVDFEAPKRYGLRQTIGDTLGIGGIMRGLRTAPVLLEICRDMERVCPDALHLNYANPMAINCWALYQGSAIETVGLCHSVQGTAAELAADIGVPVEEVDYLVAGINHLAFFLRFERGGEDLYPEVQRVIDEGRVPAWNRVRYDLLQRFGFFVTESSEHLSEYVPWYIKRDRPDLIERYNIPLDEYVYRCQAQIKAWELAEGWLDDPSHVDEAAFREALADIPLMPRMAEQALAAVQGIDQVGQSGEFASRIIHSMETDTPRTIYGNVPNHGLIENLPADCVVEVPCLVDANGVQPTRIGALPPQLAALIQTNVNVQALTVEAILTGQRQHIYQAAMLDPHTAAELDPDQITSLVDELIEAHGSWLPAFH